MPYPVCSVAAGACCNCTNCVVTTCSGTHCNLAVAEIILTFNAGDFPNGNPLECLSCAQFEGVHTLTWTSGCNWQTTAMGPCDVTKPRWRIYQSGSNWILENAAGTQYSLPIVNCCTQPTTGSWTLVTKGGCGTAIAPVVANPAGGARPASCPSCFLCTDFGKTYTLTIQNVLATSCWFGKSCPLVPDVAGSTLDYFQWTGSITSVCDCTNTFEFQFRYYCRNSPTDAIYTSYYPYWLRWRNNNCDASGSPGWTHGVFAFTRMGGCRSNDASQCLLESCRPLDIRWANQPIYGTGVSSLCGGSPRSCPGPVGDHFYTLTTPEMRITE